MNVKHMKHLKNNSLTGAISRRALLLLGGAVLSVACSKDPAGEPSLREQIVLKAALPSLTTAPAASQGAAGATKAVADATAPMTFYFARADETASGTWGAYASGALSAVRTAGSGAQALTFSATQYYLNSGLKTRLMGWYPGGATSAGDPAGAGYWDASAGTVSWTIDGSQDILTAPACSGSMTSAMPAFVFKHRLAQLQFYLYAEDEKAAVRWGKLLSAVVTAQRNRASFTLADATDTDAPVVFSGELPVLGQVVAVDHGLGVVSYYGCLASGAKRVGDVVSAGEIVAKAGETLYFAVSVGGVFVSPDFLLEHGIG